MSSVQFTVLDYILAGAFLCISLGIGIFYGVCRKSQTTDDYLFGNRKMHLLPVALSLAVTFQSATSCLGIPAEIYTFSTMFFYATIGEMVATTFSAFTIVPLLYPLRLNSAYEYLGRRFNSRAVQLLGTAIGMLQTLLYMSVVLYSPALALEAVAGIPLWASIIVVGVIGTIYTSLGGFRSVIWTDVFQFIILYGGLVVIVILGVNKVGSIGKIIDVAHDTNRLNVNTSFDPRVRHSLWSCFIGSIFTWLPNNCQQSSVQRMGSMKSQRDAKIGVLLIIPFSMVFVLLLIVVSLVILAYFTIEQCGPVDNGDIGNPNQLLPYFVMLILGNIHGIAGLFLAALFSGALSSLSSGINALAANTLNDILVNYTHKMSQARQTFLAKIIVFVYGSVAVVIAYCMKSITGPVTQIANTAFGACGGPYFGIFCLGAIFPQANWIGALVGGVVGIIFNVWLAISAVLYAKPSPQAPHISTSGCIFPNQTSTSIQNIINQHKTIFTSELLVEPMINSSSTPYSILPAENESLSGVEHLYNLSYMFFGLTGFLVTLIVGLLVSLCSGRGKHAQTDTIYLFPFLRSVWRRKESQERKPKHIMMSQLTESMRDRTINDNNASSKDSTTAAI